MPRRRDPEVAARPQIDYRASGLMLLEDQMICSSEYLLRFI
jgi:hypothetical protein